MVNINDNNSNLLKYKDYRYNVTTGTTISCLDDNGNIIGKADASHTVDVTGLRFEEIASNFMQGNMVIEEVLKGLKVGYRKVKDLKTIDMGNRECVEFTYNGKSYKLYCDKTLSESQIDDKSTAILSAKKLEPQLSKEVIAKYFDVAQEVNGQVTYYSLKTDCGFKSLDELKSALYNKSVLDKFLNGCANDQKVNMVFDDTINYIDKIGFTCADDLEKLKQEALDKIIKDFTSGGIRTNTLTSMLKRIGVKNEKTSYKAGMNTITFEYNNKMYSISCNSKVALSGTDDKRQDVYSYDSLKKMGLSSATLAKYFTQVSDATDTTDGTTDLSARYYILNDPDVNIFELVDKTTKEESGLNENVKDKMNNAESADTTTKEESGLNESVKDKMNNAESADTTTKEENRVNENVKDKMNNAEFADTTTKEENRVNENVKDKMNNAESANTITKEENRVNENIVQTYDAKSLSTTLDKSTLSKYFDASITVNGNVERYALKEGVTLPNNVKAALVTSTVNGKLDESVYQGKVGDCWLVSAMMSLSSTEGGQSALKDCISIDTKTGNVTVDFKGIGLSETITADEILENDEQTNSKYSKGDNDLLVMELAFEKLLKEINGSANSTQMDERTKRLKDLNDNKGNTLENYITNSIDDAGFAQTFVYFITGQSSNTNITSEKNTTLTLENITSCLGNIKDKYSQGDVAGATFALYDGEHSATCVDGQTYKVDVTGHNFAIMDVTSDTVTFADPYDSNKLYTMSYEEFAKLGIGMLNYTNSVNSGNIESQEKLYTQKDLVNDTTQTTNDLNETVNDNVAKEVLDASTVKAEIGLDKIDYDKIGIAELKEAYNEINDLLCDLCFNDVSEATLYSFRELFVNVTNIRSNNIAEEKIAADNILNTICKLGVKFADSLNLSTDEVEDLKNNGTKYLAYENFNLSTKVDGTITYDDDKVLDINDSINKMYSDYKIDQEDEQKKDKPNIYSLPKDTPELRKTLSALGSVLGMDNPVALISGHDRTQSNRAIEQLLKDIGLVDDDHSFGIDLDDTDSLNALYEVLTSLDSDEVQDARTKLYQKSLVETPDSLNDLFMESSISLGDTEVKTLAELCVQSIQPSGSIGDARALANYARDMVAVLDMLNNAGFTEDDIFNETKNGDSLINSKLLGMLTMSRYLDKSKNVDKDIKEFLSELITSPDKYASSSDVNRELATFIATHEDSGFEDYLGYVEIVSGFASDIESTGALVANVVKSKEYINFSNSLVDKLLNSKDNCSENALFEIAEKAWNEAGLGNIEDDPNAFIFQNQIDLIWSTILTQSSVVQTTIERPVFLVQTQYNSITGETRTTNDIVSKKTVVSGMTGAKFMSEIQSSSEQIKEANRLEALETGLNLVTFEQLFKNSKEEFKKLFYIEPTVSTQTSANTQFTGSARAMASPQLVKGARAVNGIGDLFIKAAETLNDKKVSMALDIISTGASFIPGVGGFISAGIDGTRSLVKVGAAVAKGDLEGTGEALLEGAADVGMAFIPGGKAVKMGAKALKSAKKVQKGLKLCAKVEKKGHAILNSKICKAGNFIIDPLGSTCNYMFTHLNNKMTSSIIADRGLTRTQKYISMYAANAATGLGETFAEAVCNEVINGVIEYFLSSQGFLVDENTEIANNIAQDNDYVEVSVLKLDKKGVEEINNSLKKFIRESSPKVPSDAELSKMRTKIIAEYSHKHISEFKDNQISEVFVLPSNLNAMAITNDNGTAANVYTLSDGVRERVAYNTGLSPEVVSNVVRNDPKIQEKLQEVADGSKKDYNIDKDLSKAIKEAYKANQRESNVIVYEIGTGKVSCTAKQLRTIQAALAENGCSMSTPDLLEELSHMDVRDLNDDFNKLIDAVKTRIERKNAFFTNMDKYENYYNVAKKQLGLDDPFNNNLQGDDLTKALNQAASIALAEADIDAALEAEGKTRDMLSSQELEQLRYAYGATINQSEGEKLFGGNNNVFTEPNGKAQIDAAWITLSSYYSK